MTLMREPVAVWVHMKKNCVEWSGVVLCCVVLCCVVWCGVVWCGVVWWCVVWYCAVRYDIVRYTVVKAWCEVAMGLGWDGMIFQMDQCGRRADGGPVQEQGRWWISTGAAYGASSNNAATSKFWGAADRQSMEGPGRARMRCPLS